MTRLLYVEASPRKRIGTSIVYANRFLDAVRAAHKDLVIERLHLWDSDLPEFDGPSIEAKYAKLAGRALNPPEEEAWRIIRQLVSQFEHADAIVIATPMWNFGIPYKLKHWIDLITQPGLTFTFDPATGYVPIVRSRPTMVILSSSGDYRDGPSFGRPDLATPYLHAALAFLGLGPIEVEKAGPTMGPPEVTAAAAALASASLERRAKSFLKAA